MQNDFLVPGRPNIIEYKKIGSVNNSFTLTSILYARASTVVITDVISHSFGKFLASLKYIIPNVLILKRDRYN